LGWTQDEYTSITAGGSLIFGFGGAIAGGFIADYLGPRRVALWTSVLLGLTWIIFASGAEYWQYRSFVATILYAEILLASVLSVSLFSIFMSVSWSVVAATQFTVYMACLNLSNTCGAWLAGFVEGRMSVIDMYMTAGVLQIVLVVLLKWTYLPTKEVIKVEISLNR